MLIRVASDLHLEAFPGHDLRALASLFLPRDGRDPDAVLVLAGDISSSQEQLAAFLGLLEERFRLVIYVPGNHEFYRHDLLRWSDSMRSMLRHLENTRFALDGVEAFEVGEVRFVVGTLWGDGGPDDTELARVDEQLNDFRLIAFGGRRFTSSDMAALHARQRKDFDRELQAPGKKVAVSHHLPSYGLCHPRFGNELRGGFASNSEALITAHAPALWIHGHTHDSIDRLIGSTRVICHPAGYRGEWGSPFNDFMAFENGTVRGRARFVEV